MTDTNAEDWTIRQSVLLDAVRDVAVSDAAGAMFAARHLVRLLCLELGHAEPVEREGGVVGMLYGNPPKPTPSPATYARGMLAGAELARPLPGAAPKRPAMPLPARPIRDTPQA